MAQTTLPLQGAPVKKSKKSDALNHIINGSIIILKEDYLRNEKYPMVCKTTTFLTLYAQGFNKTMQTKVQQGKPLEKIIRDGWMWSRWYQKKVMIIIIIIIKSLFKVLNKC